MRYHRASKSAVTLGSLLHPAGASSANRVNRNSASLCKLAALLLASMLYPGTGGRAGTAPNLLDFNGGPVLANPEIHNVYMDTSWDADNPAAINMASIDGFTAGLVSSAYLNSASQYGVGAATFTGSNQANFLCPQPIINGITDFFAIAGWMQCMTAPSPIPFTGTLGGVPAPDNNTVYAVYVPTGTQVNDLVKISCVDYIAYHFLGSTAVWQLTPLGPATVPQNFAYTVVPVQCATQVQQNSNLPGLLDGVTYPATHEIVEASTDSVLFTGWVNNNTAGGIPNILLHGEAADICLDMGIPSVRLTNGTFVAPYWSNKDNACVPIVDTTPPITTAALSSQPNAAGWLGAPVIVAFTSTDNESGGTGVKEIHVTLSGAQTGSTITSGSSTSVAISTQGITTVTFFAIDNAGNSEAPNTLIVRIDLTPPSISAPPNITVGTGPGATSCSAVVSSAILGSATATDDSGIVTINVSGVPAGNVFPVGTTALVYTATDPVNLIASATQFVTVNDTTPPILATPSNITVNATSPAGAMVSYTLPAATDNCAGVSVASAPPSGSTFAIGTTTVTVTATDAAHNTTSKTFTVTVIGAAGQTASLSGLVSSLGLQAGITNSLLVKLAAALAAINTGNTATACSTLTAFINEVNAQSGKKITTAEAAQLIAAAIQIQAVLGCT